MTEYEPFQLKFVIDDHEEKGEYSCVHGEYTDHDGSIVINLFQMNPDEIINTIIHEALHKAINETGEKTTPDQDHNIIPVLTS